MIYDKMAKAMANAFYVVTKDNDTENKCELPDTAEEYVAQYWERFLPEAHAAFDVVRAELLSDENIACGLKMLGFDVSHIELKIAINSMIIKAMVDTTKEGER